MTKFLSSDQALVTRYQLSELGVKGNIEVENSDINGQFGVV